MHYTKYLDPYHRNIMSFSCLFLRQWCRNVASGADRHLDITFGLQVVESSFLVSVLFREAFSHTYISFFHLLVNGFSVTCLPPFFLSKDKYRYCFLNYNLALPQRLHIHDQDKKLTSVFLKISPNSSWISQGSLYRSSELGLPTIL